MTYTAITVGRMTTVEQSSRHWY